MKRTASSPRRILGGIAASLLVHTAAVYTVSTSSPLEWLGVQPPMVEQDVEMVPVSSSSWDKNLGADPAPLDSRTVNHKETAPEVKHESLPKGQVVDVAQGNDQKSEDTKYLAEHDNKVAKETRAKVQTPFYGKAMPQQTTVQPPDPKLPKEQKLSGNQGSGTEDAKKAQKTQIAEHETPATLDRQKVAALERSEDGVARAADSKTNSGNSNRLLVTPGSLATEGGAAGSDGKAGTPDVPKSVPAAAMPGDAVGAAPNDFLQVPTGDGTFLNTREFKYAGFFNRVKQRIGEQWNPNDVLRRRDPAGHQLHKGRLTVLDLTLDETGRVISVSVRQSCGVDFLDEEAVAAIERVHSFPNPPAGLFDEDRHIRFSFGFHIDNEPGQLPLIRGRHGL